MPRRRTLDSNERSVLTDRRGAALVALGAALSLAEAAAGQVTWHVSAAAPGCPGSGSPLDPFCTIQAAIDASIDGDRVLVGPGTYTGSIDFGGKAIRVESAAGAAATILDASSGGGPAVVFRGGEGPDSVLMGFTVSRGTGMPDDVFGFFRFGGGVYVEVAAPTLHNCILSDNTADFGAGLCVLGGGGAALVNCQISDNAAQLGGGVYNDLGGALVLVNCTIGANSASFGGGVYDIAGATISNSILWDNAPQALVAAPGTRVEFSDVQGGFAGMGNLDANPMFADPLLGDLRLMPASPCIDGGHNWEVPLDRLDMDRDGDTLEQMPLDLAQRHRFGTVSGSLGPGCGEGAVVDMGAFERDDDGFAYVRLGDLDGDGTVGDTDRMTIESSWGACTDPCCLADLDRDGLVGITDLITLLSQWGGAPPQEAGGGSGDDGGDASDPGTGGDDDVGGDDGGDTAGGDGSGDATGNDEGGDDAPFHRGLKRGHQDMKPKHHPGNGYARGHQKHGFASE
jgi:hypothetical protein